MLTHVVDITAITTNVKADPLSILLHVGVGHARVLIMRDPELLVTIDRASVQEN